MAYSYVLLPGDGSNTVFSFSFPYLDQAHITAEVDGVSTSFSWLTSSSLSISPAPAADTIVRIKRTTPKDEPPVDFSDGSTLLEEDLDHLALFNLYCAQEAEDLGNDSITKNAEGVWDGQDRSTTNFADPEDDTGLVTKGYLDGAYGAQITADKAAAAGSASDASNSASTAQGYAAAADSSADSAAALLGLFRAQYLGAQASAPSVDGNGNALTSGDMYFDTTLGSTQVFNGVGWQNAGSIIEGTTSIPPAPVVVTSGHTSGGVTTIPVTGGYDAGFILVFVNGSKYESSDVDTSSGTDLVFTPALTDGDEVSWVAFGSFEAANATPADGSVTDAKVAATAAISSSKLAFAHPGMGSVLIDLESLLEADHVPAIAFMTEAQRADVAAGTALLDVSGAINAAVEFADGRQVLLPKGTLRLTSSVTRLTSAVDGWRNGMRLIGQGRDTILYVDANNTAALLWDIGYTPSPAGSAANAYKFTRDSEVANLKITQAVGRTGCDGMKLTAAFNLRMKNVWIEGMSGRAMYTPLRADITSTISDPYQCFGFNIEQCRFSEAGSWAVDFAGGQSPGLWRMHHCTIANSVGGGIKCSQGQFEFSNNLVVANGSYGGTGGMFVDVIEGAQYVALIEGNEFDTNHSYHINAYRLESSVIERNRFLSNTYSTTTGGTIVTTGGFMRPPVHCSLGTGTPGYNIINCRIERNFHRSPPTSAVALLCYTFGGDPAHNDLINNQIDATSNTTGVSRYSGTLLTAGVNRVIHDGVALYGQPYFNATASGATSIPNTGARTTVVFNTVTSSGGGYSSSLDTSTGIFTAPEAGLYHFNCTVGFNSVSVTTARAGFSINNGSLQAPASPDSGITNTPIISTSITRKLNKGDTMRVQALHASGAAVNTLTGAEFMEFSGFKIPNT